MLRLLLLFLSSAVLFGCATSRQGERVFSKKLVRQIEASPVFAQSFTGFALADAETGKILAASNADKYFTPASNTKILTLYTCLRLLGDSLPGMEYQVYDLGTDGERQVLLVRGTGDPTFLHPKFQAWQPAFSFLQAQKDSIIFYPRKFGDKRFGPGWAWDDYGYYYQVEKTALPVYGNTLQLTLRKGNLDAQPPFFRGHVFQHPMFSSEEPMRKEGENFWVAPFAPENERTYFLPFVKPDLGLVLSDTLKKTVGEADAYDFEYVPSYWRTLYSCPTDTVLRRMMYQSDNFIAEQLLLVCAGLKHNELSQKKIIQWAQDSLLTGLKQPPKWVDGSGLSRYNLNTPSNNVEILRRLWHEQAHERLFSLFPAGGTVDTTLAEWFAPKPGERPYVFAKSGSMSGVYCLSGYLVGRSGRVLAFSFMHNNFVGSNRAWKAETQRFLAQIREKG